MNEENRYNENGAPVTPEPFEEQPPVDLTGAYTAPEPSPEPQAQQPQPQSQAQQSQPRQVWQNRQEPPIQPYDEPRTWTPAQPWDRPRSAQRPEEPDVPRQSWSEPVYEPASSARMDAYTPGSYAYGAPSFQSQSDKGKSKKKKKRDKTAKKSHGFLKAACLVVVCALVAGAASWAVVDYMLDHRAAGATGRPVVLGSPLSSENLEAPTPAEPGQVLTGNQIYGLGQMQVVGVNTSFTTNVFGMTTPRAVSGSGFIISEDGYIITNYHVISYAVSYGGDLTVLMNDGTEYEAQIVGYIESNDIAVIKIDAEGLTPVAFGDSDSILVGEAVYAIGNPLGELEYTMTDGIVSAQDRVISTKDDITGDTTSINMFQITAAVNAGNSGGPVYNSRGEVIGVVTAKYADEGVEGLGFAIPINDAVNIARQLIENGYVAGAGLGITGLDANQFYNQYALDRYNIPDGVYVDTVNPDSAAEKAGVKAQDIIIGLGDRDVTSMDELKLALRHYSPGDTDTITVYRMGSSMGEGETLDLTITFQELVEENTTAQQQPQTTPDWDNGYTWGWGW